MITVKKNIFYTTGMLIFILFAAFMVINGLSVFSKSFTAWFIIMLILAFAIIGFSTYAIKSNRSKLLLQILDWATFLVFSITTVVFSLMFFLLPARIEKNSMSPTVKDGDHVLVYHFLYQPKRNDVVIIEINQADYPLVDENAFIDANNNVIEYVYFIKRIVAMPGDKIEFESFQSHFQMKVNGVVAQLNGEIHQVTNPDFLINYLDENNKLKTDDYLVFGDNDSRSEDSRNIGPVKGEDILGKVIFRLYPFGVIR